MKIDAHQHFWKYSPVRDAWITNSMNVIKRDFLPKDLHSLLKESGIGGCIAVQADQSEAETNFLLELAKQHTFIKGVVGWVDLLDKNVGQRLEYYSSNPIFKGVRHILQAEPEGFMLQEKFLLGIGKLASLNLVYEILIRADQMEEAIQLVKKFPNQTFVLDHLGKPSIQEEVDKNWINSITKLAGFSNVYCKLSGMVTEAQWNEWHKDDFKPYFEIIFKVFGSSRLLFGSDWPVCLLSANYLQVFELAEDLIMMLSDKEVENIMGKNATRIYNLRNGI